MLTHKNYLGYAIFDDAADIFHGEVINTKDIITFQGKTVAESRKAFIDSVEDYLAFCAQRGESPEKPFSGKLHLRLSPELQQKIAITAKQHGKSLNKWLIETIQSAVLVNNI